MGDQVWHPYLQQSKLWFYIIKSRFKYKSHTLSPKAINFDIDFYLRTSYTFHSYAKHKYISLNTKLLVFLVLTYSAFCEVRKEIFSYNLGECQPSKTILEVDGLEQIHSLIHFCKTFLLRYEWLWNQKLHVWRSCNVLLCSFSVMSIGLHSLFSHMNNLNGLCSVPPLCADTSSFYTRSSLSNITKAFPVNSLMIKGFSDNGKAIWNSACNKLAKRGLWISLTPVIAEGRYGFLQQAGSVPSLWSHFQRPWVLMLNTSTNEIFQLFWLPYHRHSAAPSVDLSSHFYISRHYAMHNRHPWNQYMHVKKRNV